MSSGTHAELATEAALGCVACGLSKGRSQVVLPDGPRGSILAVGEAPGRLEDERGVGFAGVAGSNLDAALSTYGIARSEYARANVVRCRPPENRRPRVAEALVCSHWLEKSIVYLRPTVIVAVGESAARYLISARWSSYLDFVESSIRDGSHRARLPSSADSRPLVIPMPHTSPLAWNRYRRGGTPIRSLGLKALSVAVDLHRQAIRD